MNAVRWVVITGLSGSGKTLASQCFEDMGYFCVDNLPVGLMPAFKTLALASHHDLPRVALVVDVRERNFLKDFPRMYKDILADGHLKSTLLFLESDSATLLKRFGESRRRHPLSAQSGDATLDLRDAIEEERRLLLPVRELADVVLDTTNLAAANLRAMLRDKFAGEMKDGGMRVSVMSFGFKHGIPSDASLVLDVRFLPNPHYDDRLRPLDGLNPLVKKFVEGKREYKQFIKKTTALLEFLLPQYRREGKSYLNIAVGCTGGKHRSVVAATALAEAVASMGFTPHVEHRDKDRE